MKPDEVFADEDDDEEYWSYHDVGEALDWLDAAEGPDGSTRLYSTFSAAGSAAAERRPNAHGGMLARTLQPLSNRTQKLASHVRAAPLEVCSFNSPCISSDRPVLYY